MRRANLRSGPALTSSRCFHHCLSLASNSTRIMSRVIERDDVVALAKQHLDYPNTVHVSIVSRI